MNYKSKKLKISVLLVVLVIFTVGIARLQAQPHNLNYGLKEPQPKSSLPVSNSGKNIVTVRKPFVAEKGELKKLGQFEYVVDKGWALANSSEIGNNPEEICKSQFNPTNWVNAIVPGTVLTSLVNQGVYPDPYFGLNNLEIPESLCRTSWWYRVPVNLPAEIKNKNLTLVLNGINYKAEVWLNGKLLGQVNGAFCRGVFDITPWIDRDKENILAIKVLPPLNPGIPQEQSAVAPRGPNGGVLCKDGPTFFATEGWDWIPGIRDRNMGIWQDVRILATGSVRIVDPQVVTDLDLPDTTKAYITIKTDVESLSEISEYFTLSASIGKYNINLKKKFKISGKESVEVEFNPENSKQLSIKNPELWWLNGYGKAALQNLTLTLKDAGGTVVDEQTIRFGIRELSYEMAAAMPASGNVSRINFEPVNYFSNTKLPPFDNINRKQVAEGVFVPSLKESTVKSGLEILEGDNPYLVIKVNGVPVFCKGGNWGMDDAMKRVGRERLEPYFRLHKEENFNMIRNWTGQNTEATFYELADEYGLLVWNDFWMSTEGYNLPPDDEPLFLKNATDVIKRFRNHPSIAIWCSRNEGYTPVTMEDSLAAVIVRHDGTRHYQPNSRNMNLRPSGPWHFHSEPAEYLNYAYGFNTELGTTSIPTAETIKGMMPPEDTWPISDAWYYHDLHHGESDFRSTLIRDYAEGSTLDNFSKTAQFLNFQSHRAMFEAWNSRMFKSTSGLLLWMSHPAWPSFVWQTYTYDYETHAAYFACKKACEPLHVQMNTKTGEVQVVNTTLKTHENLTVSAEIIGLELQKLGSKSQQVKSESNTAQHCFNLVLPESQTEIFFVVLKILDENKKELSNNFYWLKNPNLTGFIPPTLVFRGLKNIEPATVNADVKYKIEDGKLKGEIKLENTGNSLAMMIKLNLRNQSNGSRILPVYFSDGYFQLFPGESKILTFECSTAATPDNMVVTAEGYNLEKTELASINKVR